MKKLGLCLLVVAALAGGCVSRPPLASTEPSSLEIKYISEIIQYLYRWHMDETMLGNTENFTTLPVWGRTLHPKLDDGDRSEFYEVLIPDLLYRVQLKKADYTIPELGLRVTNHSFKVISAERLDARPAIPARAEVVVFERQQILDYLFSHRNEEVFPAKALLARMEAAVSHELPTLVSNSFATAQTLYLAPISPVSNDLWLFWETQRMLIKFSSDADLQSETYWTDKKLGVRFYDLDKHVVVSMAEVAGSNAFVTRDWAARVLFNCMVHGKKIMLAPLPERPAAGNPAPAGAAK